MQFFVFGSVLGMVYWGLVLFSRSLPVATLESPMPTSGDAVMFVAFVCAYLAGMVGEMQRRRN
jgi:hypothetical protein